jgi:hypothetical protein
VSPLPRLGAPGKLPSRTGAGAGADGLAPGDPHSHHSSNNGSSSGNSTGGLISDAAVLLLRSLPGALAMILIARGGWEAAHAIAVEVGDARALATLAWWARAGGEGHTAAAAARAAQATAALPGSPLLTPGSRAILGQVAVPLAIARNLSAELRVEPVEPPARGPGGRRGPPRFSTADRARSAGIALEIESRLREAHDLYRANGLPAEADRVRAIIATATADVDPGEHDGVAFDT